jgi:meiotically up-regulated gene 157 (Mug157) protein
MFVLRKQRWFYWNAHGFSGSGCDDACTMEEGVCAHFPKQTVAELAIFFLCISPLTRNTPPTLSLSETTKYDPPLSRDLPLMWIRDSAFQIGVLLPRLAKRPGLRPLIEGALRAQAFYITQDPYANGFYPDWRDPAAHNEEDRLLGRGGWVGVRNYELDSGAYYLNLLYNYWATPGLYRPENLLQEPLVFDAAMSMVDTWIVEQNHTAGTSPYRFVELPNDGLGTPVGYTGEVKCGGQRIKGIENFWQKMRV